MNPTQGCGQILRRQRRPEQTVRDHQGADDEERKLERGASVTPAKKPPQDGREQQIKTVRSIGGRRRRLERLFEQLTQSG
jgi:hypothetical protein